MATKRSKTPPPPGLSAADIERLDTWMPEIADKMLGHLRAEANGSFRLGEKRNLVIHPGGSFYDFAAGTSGRGAIKLLRVLHKCDEEKALRLAVAFLTDNLGTGSLSGSVDADEDAAIAEDDLRRTTEINEIWQAAQPIDGSPAEIYLKSRGLDPDPSGQDAVAPVEERLRPAPSPCWRLSLRLMDRSSPCRKPS